VEVMEMVVVTMLQRVDALLVVLLVVPSMAMDHGTEAFEVLMHHAFLAVVTIGLAVDGAGALG